MNNQGRQATKIGNNSQIVSKEKMLDKLSKKYDVVKTFESTGGKSFRYDIYNKGKLIGCLLGETQIYKWFEENCGDDLEIKRKKVNTKPSPDIVLILYNKINFYEIKTQKQTGSTIQKIFAYIMYLRFFEEIFKKYNYTVNYNFIINDFIKNNYPFIIDCIKEDKKVAFCDTINNLKL